MALDENTATMTAKAVKDNNREIRVRFMHYPPAKQLLPAR
jgi:hypothetical protein